MSKKNDDVAAFLNELKELAPEQPKRALVNYETFKTERDHVYKGYVLEGYTEGIESPLGTVSTAVRMVAPGNKGEPAEGRRVTIWLSSYEQNDFQRLLNSTPDEVSLPISIDFLRRLETSQKTGRDYKQFHAIYRGPVERDSLPEVHEDQFKQDTPTPAE